MMELIYVHYAGRRYEVDPMQFNEEAFWAAEGPTKIALMKGKSVTLRMGPGFPVAVKRKPMSLKKQRRYHFQMT